MRPVSLCAILVLAPLASTFAQGSFLCFRGKPLRTCRAFTLTEFSVSAWIGAQPPGDNPPAVASEVGLMLNVSGHSAVGGSFFVDVGHEKVVAGPAVRYRYWLDSMMALDFGLGAPMLGYAAYDWVTVKAKINYRDLFGPVVRLERGRATYWSVGLEGGSGIGLLGATVSALIGMIAVASLAR
jgi:hypothetical protein